MIGHHRCDSAIAAALCTARYHLALPGHLSRGNCKPHGLGRLRHYGVPAA